MKRGVLVISVLVFLAGIFSGGNREPGESGPQFGEKPLTAATPVYHLAVHPLHNPAKLMPVYQPLPAFLNSHPQGARLDLEASRDYADFEKKFRAHEPEFILPDSWPLPRRVFQKEHSRETDPLINNSFMVGDGMAIHHVNLSQRANCFNGGCAMECHRSPFEVLSI